MILINYAQKSPQTQARNVEVDGTWTVTLFLTNPLLLEYETHD